MDCDPHVFQIDQAIRENNPLLGLGLGICQAAESELNTVTADIIMIC